MPTSRVRQSKHHSEAKRRRSRQRAAHAARADSVAASARQRALEGLVATVSDLLDQVDDEPDRAPWLMGRVAGLLAFPGVLGIVSRYCTESEHAFAWHALADAMAPPLSSVCRDLGDRAEALEAPLATLDRWLVAAPGPSCEFLTPFS